MRFFGKWLNREPKYTVDEFRTLPVLNPNLTKEHIDHLSSLSNDIILREIIDILILNTVRVSADFILKCNESEARQESIKAAHMIAAYQYLKTLIFKK